MILITGGTGLVGSHLACELLKRGYEIKVFVRETSDKRTILRILKYYFSLGDAEKLYARIHWATGDLRDRFSIDEALEDIDIVYHAAGKISFQKKDSKVIKDINIKGTANLVDCCLARKVKKLCFVGSVAALGISANGKMIDEISFLKPEKSIESYAFSKFGAEMEIWRGITEGLNAVIVNPSVILGPGFWNSGSNQLFTYMAKGSYFYADGITGFVDVRDVAAIMVQLVEKDIAGERFIVSSENISYKDFAFQVAREMGIKPSKLLLPAAIAETLWRTAAVISHLTSWNPAFTKNVARSAYKKDFFSNEKLKKCLTFEFRPISETIRELALKFKEDFNLNGYV